MAFVGADVDQLRELAAELGAGAGELRDLGAQLSAAVAAAEHWQGPDATRAKDEFGSLAQVQMTDVAGALETAGRFLELQADEQDQASGESTGGSGYGWLSLIPGGIATANAIKKIYSAAKGVAGLSGFFAALRHPARGFGALSRFEKLRDAIGALVGGTKGGAVARLFSRISLPITGITAAKDAIFGTGYEGWRDIAGRGFGAVGAIGAGVLLVGGTALAAPVATAAAIGVAAYGVWSAGNYVYDNRAAIGDFLSRTWEGGSTWVGTQASGAVDAAKSWAQGFLGGGRRAAGAGA